MIVLVGEFSGVHYTLAEALKLKGHKVVLISDGDAYKKFPSDISAPVMYSKGALRYPYLVFYYLGATGFINYIRLRKQISWIDNVTVTQFINPVAIPSLGAVGNFLLFRYLKKRSDNVSLCALGDDFNWVMSCLKGVYKYSALDRLLKGGVKGFLKYSYSLKYIASPLFVLLNLYVVKASDCIIPGLTDYQLAYKNHRKSVSKIPLPIDCTNSGAITVAKYPVKIFHGWQTGKEAKKGNDLLHAAAERCVSYFGSEYVVYEVVGGLPYAEYIEKFNDSDIFLDQVFSYDCGVNALLAMACGKVVFSGFESPHTIEMGINAPPSENEIYEKLVFLIKNLEKVNEIKENAWRHVRKYHDSSLVADQYLAVWTACRAT